MLDVPDFFLPHAHAATFPSASHALWFYTQMVRWGHVPHNAANADLARRSFRPDLYRAAVAPLGASLPQADAPALGPDAFFDGRGFDPADLGGYIASQRPYA